MPNTPPFSLRVTLAAPSRGKCDPAAILKALSEPSKEMAKAIDRGMLQLVNVAARERFTGEGPFPVSQNRLGQVSNRLRRDLHSEPAEFSARGYKARIGAAVEYFAAHELGFDGTVSVRAHKRQAHTIKKLKVSRLEQSVRGHQRRMKIPARRPLATAIQEHAVKLLGEEIRETATRIASHV